MTAPDIVYVIKPGDRNDELRYSLRSIARNLTHRKVWIAGYTPKWCRNVESIPLEQMANKHRNARANLEAAASRRGVSDPFVLFNDDMFLMQPHAQIPVLNLGPLDDVIDRHLKLGTGSYVTAMIEMRDLLKGLGIDDPLSYEGHVPMTFEKGKLLQVLGMRDLIPIKGRDRFHLRTLYGNMHQVGGIRVTDCKVYKGNEHGYRDWPMISTLDRMFMTSSAGRYIRDSYPKLCVYESGYRVKGTE